MAALADVATTIVQVQEDFDPRHSMRWARRLLSVWTSWATGIRMVPLGNGHWVHKVSRRGGSVQVLNQIPTRHKPEVRIWRVALGVMFPRSPRIARIEVSRCSSKYSWSVVSGEMMRRKSLWPKKRKKVGRIEEGGYVTCVSEVGILSLESIHNVVIISGLILGRILLCAAESNDSLLGWYWFKGMGVAEHSQGMSAVGVAGWLIQSKILWHEMWEAPGILGVLGGTDSESGYDADCEGIKW